MIPVAKSQEVLKRLVEALVDAPESLGLELIEDRGHCEFSVIAAADCDKGKLLGSAGTHARAVGLIARTIGERLGASWVYRVALPDLRDRGPRSDSDARARTRRPDSHNSTADEHLLASVLAATLNEPCGWKAKPCAEPGDRFLIIRPANHVDEAILRSMTTFHKRETTLLGELGTVFRAIGLRQGVRYHVDIPTA